MIAITNVLGELVERYRYTAFGLLKVLDAEGDEKDGDALSPWLYHGRLFEQSTGLYWMRMRHYSPQLGRFLQPDPAGIAGGINLYAYSNNNPLRYFDPWGLWPAPDASGGSDGKYGEMSDYQKESSFIRELLRQLNPFNEEGSFSQQSLAMLDALVGLGDLLKGIGAGDQQAIDAARQAIDAAYDNNALGQTANGPAWAKYGTRGALGVAAAGTAATGGYMVVSGSLPPAAKARIIMEIISVVTTGDVGGTGLGDVYEPEPSRGPVPTGPADPKK